MSQAVNFTRSYDWKMGIVQTRTNGNEPWKIVQSIGYQAQRLTIKKPASYKTVIKDGWRPPAPYRYNFKHWTPRMYDVYFLSQNRSNGSQRLVRGVSNDITPPEPPYIILPTAAKAQLEIDALNAMRDGAVELGVSFGERKEAAEMMVGNFTKIRNSYRAFRRGQFRNAAKHLGLGWKDAPNRWLEYQYGWKPLLSDVYEATSRIANRDASHPQRTYLTVRKSLSLLESEKLHVSWTGFGINTYRRKEMHGLVRFDFTPDPDSGALKTADEWGLLNPLSIGWELVPFSFVVDWAVPVGDCLSSITASLPYRFKAGSYTSFCRVSDIHNAIGVYNGTVRVLACSGRGHGTSVQMERTVYDSFPFPDFRAMTHTKYKNASSEAIATRTANALSILASAFK